MRAIGTGIMSEVWHGADFTLPFLKFGAWRRIMFPHAGRDIPFTIENYAFRDPFGRDTVTWIRTFDFGTPQRFDAYMVAGHRPGHVIDYLGSHQHLAVDIELRADDEGGLCLRSSAQRFYEGPVAFTFPQLLTGVANVREWFDDAAQRFNIDVNVSNERWGPLFGYRGSFTVDWADCAAPPAHVLPVRFEGRE